MSSRERPAQQDNASHQEHEREDKSECYIRFGKARGYRADAGGLLLENSLEGMNNSDQEGKGGSPCENHPPHEPLSLLVVVHSAERLSQCQEKIKC